MLQRQLLIQFYQQGLGTQYMTLAAVGIAALVMWPVVDAALLGGWTLWFVLLVAVRVFYMRRFLRTAHAVEDLGPWEMGGLVGTTLGGLSWGLFGLTYDFAWPPFYQVFLLVLLGALAAVSTAAYSSSQRASTLFMVSTLGPVFVRFVFTDSGPSHLFVLSIAAFVLCLRFTGITAHKGVVNNVKLRLANEKLVEELSRANVDLSREIEHRTEAEDGLKQERRLFVKGPVMVFRWRAEPGWPVEYASPNVSLWGLNAEELMRNRTHYIHQYVHPEDMARVIKRGYLNNENRNREFLELDYRIVLPKGQIKWVYEHTVAIRDGGGRIVHVNGYLLDITDRKRAEQLLSEEKERAQVTLHSIGDGVITTDNFNCVTYMNPAAQSMIGLSFDEASGQPLEQVFRALHRDTASPIEDLEAHWRQRSHSGDMHAVRLATGTDVSYSMATIRDAQRNPTGSVVVLRDATRILALTRELTYYATHDALTGTLNRREFERRLKSALKTAGGAAPGHVLLYIDIDQFKVINDACGHRAGDQLLQRISALLSRDLEENDVIARLGGDEFAVLLGHRDLDQAEVFANGLREATNSARFVWEDRSFEISLSIGAVQIDDDVTNISTLLSQADMACYTAKDLGRDRLHIYREGDAGSARRRDAGDGVGEARADVEAMAGGG